MNVWALVFLTFQGNSLGAYQQQVAIAPSKAACEAKAEELIANKPKDYPNAAAIGCVEVRLANGKEI